MGLLAKLAAAPLAPAFGVIALARHLEQVAADELWSDDALRRRFAELQEALEAGEISEEEYDAEEEALLLRIEELRRPATEATGTAEAAATAEAAEAAGATAEPAS